MLSIQIVNFFTKENRFVVPSPTGLWLFNRVSTYDEIMQTRKPGYCAVFRTGTSLITRV